MELNHIIAVIIAATLVWLLLRELNAWYWKINRIIELLQEISSKLGK